MSFRSLAFQRCAISLSALFIVSACTDDGRPTPLSEVELVPPGPGPDLPQSNQNIDNPTLNIPATFEVSPGDELTLVWSDEFDGAQLDPETWFFATGDGTEKGLPGGWGNNELQYYLPDSAQIADGVLSITARRETVEGLNYTSARINTEDRFAFKYGRIEASIKLPAGKGLWPAFWMLPQDTPYGTWAASGEIDVVEAVNLDGSGSDEIFGTIHFGGEFPANTSAGTTYVPSADITNEFHTYAVEWDEFEIRWYFDDMLYGMQNAWSSTAAPYPAPFDQPFHILLNLAVGGNFPGSPDGSTVLPATMEVDWVRVYSGEDTPVDPADPGIIPDDVIYASDPDETVDLVATVSAFGTTSTFDGEYALDADFNPAFETISGTGYSIPHIAQLGLIDLPAGFATGYESFSFKIKSADLPGNSILVKLQSGGAYGDVSLTDTTVSTPLGNGWYQVVLPMSGFADVAPAVGVVFEAQDQTTGFSFLLTDIGFNNPTGGAGVIPDDVIYATDPAEVIDLVATVSAFGTTSMFNDSYALDADFNPSFETISGTGYGIPHIAQLGLIDLPAGFATDYETFSFKIKSADLPGNSILVKLQSGGAYGDVSLADTTVSTPLGNDWYQVVLPMSGFADVAPAVGVVFEAQDQTTGFSFLLTDIGFSGTGGPGGGGCPPVGSELATNGDFEAGDLSCWEGIVNNGTITADNIENNTVGGAWSAHVVAGAGGNPTIKQNFLAEGTVMIGDTIDISFDMKGTAGAGGVIFPKLISEGATGSDGPILETIAAPTAGWTTYTYSPTITADVARGITFEIAVVCGTDPGCTADVFIDNVSVTIR